MNKLQTEWLDGGTVSLPDRVELEAGQDFRAILRSELNRRMRQNPYYSLRAFARDLKVVPSRISEILSGKQGLSPKCAQKIAKLLRMSEEEASHFIDLVTASHARSPRDRHGAKLRLLKSQFDFSMQLPLSQGL